MSAIIRDGDRFDDKCRRCRTYPVWECFRGLWRLECDCWRTIWGTRENIIKKWERDTARRENMK
jgi:hypothetical protein